MRESLENCMSLDAKPVLEFGPYRLDVEQRLLFRDDGCVPLTPKAFDTLLVLVENAGRLVEKEALMQRVWPETFVEDGSLAFNISALRKALGDDRQNGNRYIETVSRRGYRFTAPVTEPERAGGDGPSTGVEPPAANAAIHEVGTAVGAEPALSMVRTRWRHSQLLFFITGAAAAAVVFLLYVQSRQLPRPRVLGSKQLTHDGRLNSGPVTDGANVYFGLASDYGGTLAEVAASGGETLSIPMPFEIFGVLDISARRRLLVVGGPWRGIGHSWPLWEQPLPAGAPRRIGDLTAYSAAWSPDGQAIAYILGQDIYVAGADGGHPHRIASFPEGGGRPSGTIRWSPNGKVLRFPSTVGASVEKLWQVSSDGVTRRELLPGWHGTGFSGGWTPDGRYYVFSCSREGRTEIWALREASASGSFSAHPQPVQLTRGPLNYSSPVSSPDGKRLFVIGWEMAGELVRWEAKQAEFIPFLNGICASSVSFSRDRRWVAYTKFPDATLWRMRPDGSEEKQLTFSPMETYGLDWSPDGTAIAILAKVSGGPSKIYLVPTAGGDPVKLLRLHGDEEGIPTWSPDGKRIALGDVPKVFGHGTGNELIHVYDLATHELSSVPGSGGLWSSRWSPAGRYIAALTIAHQGLMVYDMLSGRWRDLHVPEVNNLAWSRDDKFISFSLLGGRENSGIFRVRVSDGIVERTAKFNGMRRAAYWWNGLAPDDSPIVLRDIGTHEVYALDVEWP